MMRPNCVLFGAGQPPAFPPKISARDYVIAVDGGYHYTQSVGIKTDLLIGDFDSLNAFYDSKDSGLAVKRLPKEKDQTDMLAALQYGLESGFDCFHIYGGTGGRLDHTLANIQCLVYLIDSGARGFLHDGNTVITAFHGELHLPARQRGVISVFAIGGPAEGVCLRGLEYELEDARLTCGFPLGVSNAFTGNPALIKVSRGTLLVVYPADVRELHRTQSE